MLLQVVKEYLQITWSDEDSRIQGIIDRGKAYLDSLAGVALDYTTPSEDAHAAYVQALAGILEAVRREEDPVTIQEGIARILAAEGQRDQAVAETKPHMTLLLDYCRYAYNNASEYFEENFQKEILRLQLKTGVSLLPVEDEEDEN